MSPSGFDFDMWGNHSWEDIVVFVHMFVFHMFIVIIKILPSSPFCCEPNCSKNKTLKDIYLLGIFPFLFHARSV